ncbi:MAG: preprotein translocase subunit SecY [Caldisericia bacterium]|nr:preprotein translocase subunit SecY [Caldisericia bacterium]
MLKNFFAAFKLPEVKKRLLITMGIFLLIRLGYYIIMPYIDRGAIAGMVDQGGFLALLDLFSGGGYQNFSIFTLGVLPYINSSIILQLLVVVIPHLENLSKEGGEEGRRQIARYTNYLALVLAALQAFMFTNYVFVDALINTSITAKIVIMTAMVAGSFLLIWLGEFITEKGMGNGVSLIIFVGIITRIPMSVREASTMIKGGTLSYFTIIVTLVVLFLVLAGIIYAYQSERRIAVQYSRRISGGTAIGGEASFIPIKLVQTGVLPIIFASSVLTFPTIIAQFVQGTDFEAFVTTYLASQTSFVFNIGFFLLIVFFTYFYTTITYDPDQMAENLQKSGGFIPGVRPGEATAEFIRFVLSRITFPASIFLGALAVVPNLLLASTSLSIFYFGGTSILIIVGVAVETGNQMEAFLAMRQYKGFLRG